MGESSEKKTLLIPVALDLFAARLQWNQFVAEMRADVGGVIVGQGVIAGGHDRVVIHLLNQLNSKIDKLASAQEAQGEIVNQELQTLIDQVKANTDAEASAATLINSLADQIKANANDANAIRALSDQLKASADSLASAVVANTPAGEAAPAPTPTPTPAPTPAPGERPPA